MKTFFALAATLLLITACSRNNTPVGEKNEGDSGIATDTTFLVGEYRGILPCADCSGILTVLKLYSSRSGANNYQLERTYQGKNDSTPIIEKGAYNTERGFEDDNDATIIVLNWESPENQQAYFVSYSKDNKTLYKLNSEKKRIKSTLNYTLKLVSDN